MHRFKTIVLLSFLTCFSGMIIPANAISVIDLKTEYLKNPVGIDQLHPRFYWKLKSNIRNSMQKAYQVQVYSDPDFESANKKVWDTGKVNSVSFIFAPTPSRIPSQASMLFHVL